MFFFRYSLALVSSWTILKKYTLVVLAAPSCTLPTLSLHPHFNASHIDVAPTPRTWLAQTSGSATQPRKGSVRAFAYPFSGPYIHIYLPHTMYISLFPPLKPRFLNPQTQLCMIMMVAHKMNKEGNKMKQAGFIDSLEILTWHMRHDKIFAYSLALLALQVALSQFFWASPLRASTKALA